MVDRGYLVSSKPYFQRQLEVDYIRFAMLTGYPPFQSTTQDEIYRRVRSVEYKWPKEQECMNDIPEEAMDLVARLLTANAEERPDLDRIVGHPFFAMHGGNAIPLVIGSACRTSKPTWLESKSPRGDVMKKSSHLLPLTTLARNCGVGELNGFTQAFEVVGEKVEISLYKECLEEEIAKSYPIVPLPADMVYTGKPDQNGRWNTQTSHLQPLVPAAPKPASSKLSRDLLTEIDELQANLHEARRRPTVPSHASTLRAPPYTTLRPRGVNKSTVQPTSNLGQAAVPSKVAPGPTRPNRPNRGLLKELPVRSASTPSQAVAGEPRARPTTRVTRSQSANLLSISTSSSAGSTGTADQPELSSRGPEEGNRPRGTQQKVQTSSRTYETRGVTIKKSPKRGAQPLRRGAPSKSTGRTLLVGPDEVAECIPKTRPQDVVSNLRKIRAELDSAINGGSSSATNVELSCYDRKKSQCSLPLIHKWVDYTNKYGIGYILASGTVGCVFKADSSAPQSYVVVAGAEAHLNKRRCAAYAEKDQILPTAGAPAEFLEDCPDGIKRVIVQAAKYQLEDGAVALEEKLCPGETIHDLEKRKRLTIWAKFGKYMTQQLGKDFAAQLNADPSLNAQSTYKHTIAGPFVKFYQRLGNVGIWGFGDGSFQFNFPDHTKIIITGDGSWLDFYHLPIPAADILKRGALLTVDTLTARSCLSYPPAILARGVYREEDFRDIIAANDFIAKLTFVNRVVGAWLDAGGLGGLKEEDKYLQWDGAAEGESRLLWVSIGAYGGDERYGADEK